MFSAWSNVRQKENTTHFGFETILEKDKAEKVQSVFSSVASKYDVMNDLMSLEYTGFGRMR